MIPPVTDSRRTRGLVGALVACLSGTAMFIGFAAPANAIPKMQLYVEGATYDTTSETWIGTPDASGLLRLWVILAADGDATCDEDTGVCTGSDSTRKFRNVRVAISFPDPPGGGGRAVTLAPALLGGTAANTFGGFTGSGKAPAPSGAQNPDIFTQGDANNGPFVDVDEPGKKDTPAIDSKKSLGAHGEYVDGRTWQEYTLGDFDLDSLAPGLSLVLIDDFNGTDPLAPEAGKTGLILAYDIDASAFTPLVDWHFDAYAVLESEKCTGPKTAPTCSPDFKPVFAPFSHDAGGTGGDTPPPPPPPSIPEPATLGLLGLGFLGLALARRRRAA